MSLYSFTSVKFLFIQITGAGNWNIGDSSLTNSKPTKPKKRIIRRIRANKYKTKDRFFVFSNKNRTRICRLPYNNFLLKMYLLLRDTLFPSPLYITALKCFNQEHFVIYRTFAITNKKRKYIHFRHFLLFFLLFERK